MEPDDLGYGLKYNLALEKADIYNGERYTYYTEEDDAIIEEEDSPYLYGYNYASNLYYRHIRATICFYR